ncbi:putative RNA-binding Zn ribbon-like protein [Nocardioides daedukensis]|uniref:Putative RNA-binding Zn ribbon-like protein n=1 Tax=Nocardioides daedukensis TaxID=634462 RepID=A0A7Y9S4U9_9ACTN|nr:CGNR zinc finger domain-containing protein [Nocardioides daedukensis]NYG60048.1 putative RNA-binding Zn ribbon-like protein [Nocardioides daedukensis]
MDVVGYAEAAAGLLNADLADADALIDFLEGREWLHRQIVDKDIPALRKFQTQLRPVFEAAENDDPQGTVNGLNALMERHPITPRIFEHAPGKLQLHVANKASTVSDLIISESLLGLANLVCDLGAARLGICSAAKCDRVYVDTSPNRSRRYCSDRCSSRANVAAYRARQRAAATG